MYSGQNDQNSLIVEDKNCFQESIKTLKWRFFSIFLMNNQTEMIEVIVTVNQFTNYSKNPTALSGPINIKVLFQLFHSPSMLTELFRICVKYSHTESFIISIHFGLFLIYKCAMFIIYSNESEPQTLCMWTFQTMLRHSYTIIYYY